MGVAVLLGGEGVCEELRVALNDRENVQEMLRESEGEGDAVERVALHVGEGDCDVAVGVRVAGDAERVPDVAVRLRVKVLRLTEADIEELSLPVHECVEMVGLGVRALGVPVGVNVKVKETVIVVVAVHVLHVTLRSEPEGRRQGFHKGLLVTVSYKRCPMPCLWRDLLVGQGQLGGWAGGKNVMLRVRAELLPHCWRLPLGPSAFQVQPSAANLSLNLPPALVTSVQLTEGLHCTRLGASLNTLGTAKIQGHEDVQLRQENVQRSNPHPNKNMCVMQTPLALNRTAKTAFVSSSEEGKHTGHVHFAPAPKSACK